MNAQWTIQDLIFLRGMRIGTDAETFAQVRRTENTHRDFAICSCGAITFSQHRRSCPRASILFRSDWYERIERKTPGREILETFWAEDR